MERNVCTVNFNTPELTRAAILSLWKHTPGCQVTVFDNSDRLPFGTMDGVRVIDNTRGRVVDFLDFHWREAYHYPTFNVADVAICAGVGLILLHTIRCSRRKR